MVKCNNKSTSRHVYLKSCPPNFHRNRNNKMETAMKQGRTVAAVEHMN